MKGSRLKVPGAFLLFAAAVSVPNPTFVTKFPGGASRLAALLLAHISPICSLVAPCDPGAAPGDFGNERRIRDTRAGAQTPPVPPVASELRGKFEKRVQEISARVDGVVGYAIVDLTTGERIGHLEHETFPTASAIKLAIVYELFKQAGEGKVRLDEMVTLDRRQAVGGTGVLVEMGTPTLSIRDYAVLMVTLSDNTATNVLIDRLGMDKIAARMQGLGLPGTKLRRHMMDTAAARRGDENVSTPDELVRLLEAMHGPMSGPAKTGHYLLGEAIELLKKPKENRLRKGLPEGVASADKSGELEGVRVDAGIVFAKNRPYALCVMTTFLKDEAEGERAIEEISRVAYEYFSRLGAGGTLGRLNGK